MRRASLGRAFGSASESRMRIGTDAVVRAFAGWTVGYQVGFMVGLPAYADAISGSGQAPGALSRFGVSVRCVSVRKTSRAR